MITLTSDITVRLVEKAGGDHMVAAAARVSTCGEEALALADPSRAGECRGLIRFLMRHRHGTPFEKGYACLFVHAPAFVWWQWTRHRVGHSFSMESARYSELEPVFYVPPPDRPMIEAVGHKPSSPKFVVASAVSYRGVEFGHRASFEVAWREYQFMLGRGVASEVARDVLPFSIYYSAWVALNPRSLMHFLSLRTHDPDSAYPSHVQYEIEVAARKVEAIFAEHWPLTHAAFNEFGRVAP